MNAPAPSTAPAVDQIRLGTWLYVTFPPRWAYPRVLHRQLWELMVTHRGAWEVTTPNRTVLLHKHEALLIPPGVPHGTRVHGDVPWLGLDLHFVVDWPPLRRAALQALRPTPQGLRLLRDFLDVRGEDALADARRRATLALLLMELIHPTTAREPASVENLIAGDGEHALVARVIEQLRADLPVGLRMEVLSRQTGYSASWLRELFRRHTGVSLTEAMFRLRLEEAQRLLVQSPFKISAVARMVGFRHHTKFNEFFRRRMGCTPSEYARSNRRPGLTMRSRSDDLGGDEVRLAERS